MKKYRVIVAGSRTFHDYKLVAEELDELFCMLSREDCEIVSGMASGVDSLGIRYGLNNGISIKEFPADWDKFGKMAGPIRNEQMARYGNRLIIFWDGKSRGSKNMLECAAKHKLDYVTEIRIT